MFSDQLLYFSGLAASIGFVHTLLGPDHYLPFVFLAQARKWSQRKTMAITMVCGAGHVLSSVVIGFAGVAMGAGVNKLIHIEGMRGGWAAWGFTLVGFVYMIWGIFRAIQNKPHKHVHKHGSVLHEHQHVHASDHDHYHESEKVTRLTPWVLFIIFVLGPCEPLIPVLIYPSLETQGNLWETIIIASVFSVVTIATMSTLVFLLQKGVSFIRLRKFERYTHAIAGAILMFSGIGILFLGL
jgi:sulfite exporter TauE/SafE